MLQSENDWLNAERLLLQQEVFETRVAGMNPGGIIVNVGQLKGFVPKSQLSSFHQLMFETSTCGASIDAQKSQMGLGQYVALRKTGWPDFEWHGRSVVLRVTEIDRARNRIILSESVLPTNPADSE